MICRERCVSKIVPDALKSAELTENWRGYFVGGAGWKSESERVVSAMAP